jgi:hypothetical protein
MDKYLSQVKKRVEPPAELQTTGVKLVSKDDGVKKDE